MSTVKLKPEIAVWAEFAHRIGWSTTYSTGCLIVHGQRPLLMVCTDALGDGRMQKQTAYAEKRAPSRNSSTKAR